MTNNGSLEYALDIIKYGLKIELSVADKMALRRIYEGALNDQTDNLFSREHFNPAQEAVARFLHVSFGLEGDIINDIVVGGFSDNKFSEYLRRIQVERELI